MLADFAVGGQRFGKHKHRGFRKLVLANVVRRQCGRRVFCDLLIVDADYFDISRRTITFSVANACSTPAANGSAAMITASGRSSA